MVVGIEAETRLALCDVREEVPERPTSVGTPKDCASMLTRPNGSAQIDGHNVHVDLREEVVGTHPADEACIRAGKLVRRTLRVGGIAVTRDHELDSGVGSDRWPPGRAFQCLCWCCAAR